MLNVVDEFTREALTITVDRAIDADKLVAVLDRLAAERGGPPAFLRFDNGPEFIASAVADWCRFGGTRTVFIDPGSPWQNAWIESFSGRFRDEFLKRLALRHAAQSPGPHRGLAHRLQLQPTPHRPRRPHTPRVRPSLEQPTTSTRITAGPVNGDPSGSPPPRKPERAVVPLAGRLRAADGLRDNRDHHRPAPPVCEQVAGVSAPYRPVRHRAVSGQRLRSPPGTPGFSAPVRHMPNG